MKSTDEKMAQVDNYLGRGNIALQRGDPEEAIQWYRKAADLNPSCNWPEYNIANVLRDMGRSAEAIESYKAAIEKDPLDPDSHRNLAHLYLKLGKLSDAASELEKCIELSRGADPRDEFNLGRLYDQIGNELGTYYHYDKFVLANPAGCVQQVIAAKRRMEKIKSDSFGGESQGGVVLEGGRLYWRR